jgi:hypothetical protein
VITGGLHPGHAAIARFRARHEKALGGLFSQVLRLLAAGGMVALGLLSLDGTKLAGDAAQQADRTLPQLEKLLAGAAAADAAGNAQDGGNPRPVTPRALAGRAGRRERLAAARDRLAAGDQGRREAQRARQEAWDAAAAAGRGGGRRPGGEPRTNRNTTGPRADITGPDVRVMRNQKGYVAGCNGQLVVTAPAGHRRRNAVPAPGRPPAAAPAAGHLPPAAGRGRHRTAAADRARRLRLPQRGELRPRRRRRPAAARAAGQRPWPAPPPAPPKSPGTSTGFRPPPAPGGARGIPAAGTATGCGPAPWNLCPGSSRPARS